uniref:E3 ubiquitin-protein ligase RHF2A n=1 Tax=Arundo donax TaxID=35708 RepID=A0A0A9GHY2_ARUDO
MCWQAISMKDPLSQELLEAVVQERSVQENPARTTTVFRHPLLGDFEVPVGADDAELEEHIMQHLAAAAAAIRRSHRHARREGRRSTSAAHGHPQILAFSTTEAVSGVSMPLNSQQEGDNEHSPAIVSAVPFAPVTATEERDANTSVNDTTLANGPIGSNNRVSFSQSLPINQDGAGPSESQSFSDTLKSRLQSVSTKYKDSITKSTRGWKERWFTQNNTISNLSSEVKREVNARIAAVSRMMERLETQEGTRQSSTSPSNVHSASDTNNQGQVPALTPSSATCVSRSGSQ